MKVFEVQTPYPCFLSSLFETLKPLNETTFFDTLRVIVNQIIELQKVFVNEYYAFCPVKWQENGIFTNVLVHINI